MSSLEMISWLDIRLRYSLWRRLTWLDLRLPVLPWTLSIV